MAAFALSFILVAGVFTQFFARNRVVLNEAVYENHRLVGAPGASQLASAEGYGVTSFGRNGLVVDKELRDDVTRVAFIGDSFVKAKQVSDSEKFTEIVENLWNQTHPERQIQTLNLGLGGQDMRTFLSFGRNMDRHFQPDLVLVMISSDDFRAIASQPQILSKLVDGTTAPLTKPERPSKIQNLINDIGLRSLFGQLQSQTFAFVDNVAASQPVEAAGLQPRNRAETMDDPFIIQLRALEEIWGDRLMLLYRKRVPDLGRDAPLNIDDPVLDAIDQLGIPLLNLYPLFLQLTQEKRPPFGFNNSVLGTGHLNRFGHQQVAEEIVHFMERSGSEFQ